MNRIVTKEEAIKLMTENKPVFNINTGFWYRYNYGVSTVAVLPVGFYESLPEDGWVSKN
jgi:hypothetical protein